MKQVSIIVCVSAGTLFLLVGAVVTMLWARGTAYDRESEIYAQRVLVEILKNPNEETLFSVASPGLRKSATKAKVDVLFTTLNRLGDFVDCTPVQGQADIVVALGEAEVVSARYTARASFSNGPVLCELLLIMHGNHWQVESLYIQSPADDAR